MDCVPYRGLERLRSLPLSRPPQVGRIRELNSYKYSLILQTIELLYI